MRLSGSQVFSHFLFLYILPRGHNHIIKLNITQFAIVKCTRKMLPTSLVPSSQLEFENVHAPYTHPRCFRKHVVNREHKHARF